jgi:hypothetical protein
MTCCGRRPACTPDVEGDLAPLAVEAGGHEPKPPVRCRPRPRRAAR